MKSIFVIVATVALGLLAPGARAARIPGVTASTNMGSSIGYNLVNTVNGAGLPGNLPSLSGHHAATNTNNAWLSTRTTGTITFNLNGTYSLAGFSFWNTEFNDAINGVTVQSSSDGVNFSPIAGAPTQFLFGIVPIAPQIFSFSPVTASFVRFVVVSNYGESRFTGFAEVQFNSFDAPPTSTPEPGTVLGLLAIGGVLLATRRSKG
jgi:hypothetical protein